MTTSVFVAVEVNGERCPEVEADLRKLVAKRLKRDSFARFAGGLALMALVFLLTLGLLLALVVK